MDTVKKVMMLREAANKEAILNCYRDVAFRAIRELKQKKEKIMELESIIHDLREKLKQPV